MKTIGTILLLIIFLGGSYWLGTNSPSSAYNKKMDSLKSVDIKQRIQIRILTKSKDSLKSILLNLSQTEPKRNIDKQKGKRERER